MDMAESWVQTQQKKQLIMWLREVDQEKNIEIDLFGGEPTLIMDTIKEIIKYARDNEEKWGKRVRFTMTTNATLLTPDMMDYMDKENGKYNSFFRWQKRS